MKIIRKFLFWLIWNVPLGKLAPHILGLALGRKPHRVEQKDPDEEWKSVRDKYSGEADYE